MPPLLSQPHALVWIPESRGEGGPLFDELARNAYAKLKREQNGSAKVLLAPVSGYDINDRNDRSPSMAHSSPAYSLVTNPAELQSVAAALDNSA